MQKLQNIFLVSILIIILAASLFLCQLVVKNARINQINKIDIAELNHIRYGLLSVDSWKEQITDIVLEEIDKLDLTVSNQRRLKKAIEAQLLVLIDKVNERIQESNRGTFKGWARQRVYKAVVKIDEIKKGVPGYADAMLLEMKKPNMKGKIKNILKEKILYYIKHSYDPQNMEKIDLIVKKTNAKDIDDARIKLAEEISRRFRHTANQSFSLIVLASIMFLLPFFIRRPITKFQFSSMVIMLLILLVAGVSTPMIDLEARITEMTFVLMNNPVTFENQVLFFQSKSILDVFWIMIKHRELQMKFVGILLIVFSIIFPLTKLISALVYYFHKKVRRNKYVIFFVMRSGKWSMADVMVIAIFMSYIGFNGIITSQLSKLESTTKELVIMTTNGTSLQPGYYIFLAYVLLSMMLTSFLHSHFKKKAYTPDP